MLMRLGELNLGILYLHLKLVVSETYKFTPKWVQSQHVPPTLILLFT